MSEYSSLKATINANVKTNGNQEITGSIMNSVLNAMVDSLGAGYQFIGVATPTNPGSAQTPDYKCFYLAITPGTYTNLGGLVVADGEVALLKYDSSWTKEVAGIATAAQLNQLSQRTESQNDSIENIEEFLEPIGYKIPVVFKSGFAHGMWTGSNTFRNDGMYGKAMSAWKYDIQDFIVNIQVENLTEWHLYIDCFNNDGLWLNEINYGQISSSVFNITRTFIIGNMPIGTVYVGFRIYHLAGGAFVDITESDNFFIEKPNSNSGTPAYMNDVLRVASESILGKYDDIVFTTEDFQKGTYDYNGNYRTDGNYGKGKSSAISKVPIRDFFIRIFGDDSDISQYKLSTIRYDENGAFITDQNINATINSKDYHVTTAEATNGDERGRFFRINIYKIVDGNIVDMPEKVSFVVYTKDTFVVDINGAGDFTSLQTAIYNVEDSKKFPKTIIVKAGTYMMDEYTSTTKCHNRYLNIIGENRNSCIVKNTKGSYDAAGYYDNACLKLAGNCLIQNLTIISLSTDYPQSLDSVYKHAYCVHIDFDAAPGDKIILDNCTMINDHYSCVGIGLKDGFEVVIKDCRLSSTFADADANQGTILCHDASGGQATGQVFSLDNCLVKSNKNIGVNIHNDYNSSIELNLHDNVVSSIGNGFAYDSTYHEKSDFCFGNNVAEMNK